ncbi:GPI mannosyltransferase 2-like [Dendronephthya gigantea]|uniref:GPI mannosyltransferase 2-like n=1 Tax=Dendronephthya gigantea TaxID=151771 RepID=UPI001069DFFD|nr:GPI mannosyltransferase 2-like [Dendronephthya gigantea]XP_028414831.1 GPI mannosyltransferase 2-like [Dendronephthya gigantea]
MVDFIGVKKVVKIALISRILSLVFQGVSNNLLVDYDTSVEHRSCHPNNTYQSPHKLSTMDQIISSTLGGLSKWDAVYFLDIAQYGYKYEQNMAFFPLLPLSVHTLGVTLRPLTLVCKISQRSILLLSAMLINTVAFTMAAVGLHKLTSTVFHSPKLAQKVAMLFCFNPASVFFSSVYSESIYSMTQFWGMLYVERGNHLPAAIMFSLGTSARSNGITSCGFIAYKFLKEIILHYRLFTSKAERIQPIDFGLKCLRLISLSCLIFLPFILFQYFGYTLFCKPVQISPWCDHYIPLPYSYIQKHYWNVGFLKYYEVKQLPNFLLALPVVILSALGIREYLGRQSRRDVLSLGLLVQKKSNSLNLFAYVAHLSFLMAFGVTSMHVQVVTRFLLSSSPMVYWIAVSWVTPARHDQDSKNNSNLKANFVYIYFLMYYTLGYLLHCNFYPWT